MPVRGTCPRGIQRRPRPASRSTATFRRAVPGRGRSEGDLPGPGEHRFADQPRLVAVADVHPNGERPPGRRGTAAAPRERGCPDRARLLPRNHPLRPRRRRVESAIPPGHLGDALHQLAVIRRARDRGKRPRGLGFYEARPSGVRRETRARERRRSRRRGEQIFVDAEDLGESPRRSDAIGIRVRVGRSSTRPPPV